MLFFCVCVCLLMSLHFSISQKKIQIKFRFQTATQNRNGDGQSNSQHLVRHNQRWEYRQPSVSRANQSEGENVMTSWVLRPKQNLHDAGRHSVSLWAARFLFLQRWTTSSSTDGELADFPCSNSLPLGPVGLITLLGASGPFRPLCHITVFDDHAGLERHWHFLLGT